MRRVKLSSVFYFPCRASFGWGANLIMSRKTKIFFGGGNLLLVLSFSVDAVLIFGLGNA